MTLYKPPLLDKAAPIVNPADGRITPYFQRFWQNLSFTAADGGAAAAAVAVLEADIITINGQITTINLSLAGKQPLDSDLTALAANTTNGLWARTAAGTGSARTITGTAAEVTVVNGDGAAGNPSLSLPTALTFTGKTITGGTFASPAFTTPALGTPASGVATNLTGTAAGLTAGNVTTNANLTGPITSTGNATAVAAQTGTGSTFVMQASPALTTPDLGAATGVSVTLNTSMSVDAHTSGAPPSWALSTGYIAGADGAGYRFGMDGYGASGSLGFRRANGTNNSKSALSSGDVIGSVAMFGYGATGYSGNRGGINLTAAQNWTDANQGTAINFIVTPNGTTSTIVAWSVDNGGHFYAGLDNVYNIGNTAASRPANVRAGTSVVAPIVKTTATTVASLTAAATAGAGARAFVTDANATTFLSVVAGGGANPVPVVCDGVNWLIG